MAHYVKTSRHILSSVTNHGLIKILVQRTLAQHNLTCEQFLPGVGVHQAPTVSGVGEERSNGSPQIQLGGGVKS